MALVRAKDTKPELRVRRITHAAGYRYRLHRRDLPGSPDLVFPGRRKAILVHGCFWHRHADPDCRLARTPKSRQDFWVEKLEGNARRDAVNEAKLRALGWDVLVLWECEMGSEDRLRERIVEFLGRKRAGD